MDSIDDKDTQTSLKSILKKPQTGPFQEDAYLNQMNSDGDITDDEFCGYLMLEDITEEDENQESSTESKDNTKKVRFENNLQAGKPPLDTKKPCLVDLQTSFKLFEEILSKRNKTTPEKHVTISESNLADLRGENRHSVYSREYPETAPKTTAQQTIKENQGHSQNLVQYDESEDEIEARHTTPGFVARDYVHVDQLMTRQVAEENFPATTIPRYNSLTDFNKSEFGKIMNRSSSAVESSGDFYLDEDTLENRVNLNRNEENYEESREVIPQFNEQLRSKENSDKTHNLGDQIELIDEDIINQYIHILEPPRNFQENESILKDKINVISRHNSFSDFSEAGCGKIMNRRSSLVESSGDFYTDGDALENIVNLNLNEENYEDNRKVIQQFDDQLRSRDHRDKIQNLEDQFELINNDVVNQVQLPGNVHDSEKVNINHKEGEEIYERGENVPLQFENEVRTNVSDEYYKTLDLDEQTEIFERNKLNYDSFIPNSSTYFNDERRSSLTGVFEDQRGNFGHNAEYSSHFDTEITDDYEDKSQNLGVKTETGYNTINLNLSFIEPPDNFQDDRIFFENPIKFEDQGGNREPFLHLIPNVANNPTQMTQEFAGNKDVSQNMTILGKNEDLENGIGTDSHIQIDGSKMIKYQNIELPEQHYDARKQVKEHEDIDLQKEIADNEVIRDVKLKQVLENKNIDFNFDPHKCFDFSSYNEGDEESSNKNITNDSDMQQLNNATKNKLSLLPLSANKMYEKESDNSKVIEDVKTEPLPENEIINLNFDTNEDLDFTLHHKEDEENSIKKITNDSATTKNKLFLLPPTALSSTNKMYEPVYTNPNDVHSPSFMSPVLSPNNNFHWKNESFSNDINMFDFNSKTNHNKRENNGGKMVTEEFTIEGERHNDKYEETLGDEANYEKLEQKDDKQEEQNELSNISKDFDEDSNKNVETPKIFNELNNRLNMKPIVLPKTFLSTPITYERVFTPTFDVTTPTFDGFKITEETRGGNPHHEVDQDDNFKEIDNLVLNSPEMSQSDENSTSTTFQHENVDVEKNFKEGDKSFRTNEGLARLNFPRANKDDEISILSVPNVNPGSEQRHKDGQVKESVFRSVYRTLSDASRKRQEDRLKREKVEIEKEVVETPGPTLDEINERLLVVKSCENVHDQMMIIQELNNEIDRRIDGLNGKNDSESISMLQLLFRVLRTLSAIDCRSDNELKKLQIELRQDVQKNITLISSNY